MLIRDYIGDENVCRAIYPALAVYLHTNHLAGDAIIQSGEGYGEGVSDYSKVSICMCLILSHPRSRLTSMFSGSYNRFQGLFHPIDLSLPLPYTQSLCPCLTHYFRSSSFDMDEDHFVSPSLYCMAYCYV